MSYNVRRITTTGLAAAILALVASIEPGPAQAAKPSLERMDVFYCGDTADHMNAEVDRWNKVIKAANM